MTEATGRHRTTMATVEQTLRLEQPQITAHRHLGGLHRPRQILERNRPVRAHQLEDA